VGFVRTSPAYSKTDFSSFNIFKSLPNAEKKGLLATVVAVGASVAGCNTSLSLSLAAIFYVYNKYQQDQAVKEYYKEIESACCDCQQIQNIFRNSPNVQAMGGSDAIHNACATRIFCN